jgi:hypothetical protein
MRSLYQDFEFPVLLVLLYVRVASPFHIERVGPDQFWPATACVVPVWNAIF